MIGWSILVAFLSKWTLLFLKQKVRISNIQIWATNFFCKVLFLLSYIIITFINSYYRDWHNLINSPKPSNSHFRQPISINILVSGARTLRIFLLNIYGRIHHGTNVSDGPVKRLLPRSSYLLFNQVIHYFHGLYSILLNQLVRTGHKSTVNHFIPSADS